MIQADVLIGLGVLFYTIGYAIMIFCYSNKKFTGNDAAGNGMAKGLTIFYGLGILFASSLLLTGVNAFFFNQIEHTWIKVLFFIPLALSIVTLIWVIINEF